MRQKKSVEDISNSKCVSIVWHIHQPFFIPDSEIQRQIHESYNLILKVHQELEIPLCLNVTGGLLERFKELNSPILSQIILLQNKGLLELLGSGHNHPMMPMLSDASTRAQIEKDCEIKKSLFKVKPTGFWPTDLGWTPWMVPVLKDFGYDWTIVDTQSLISSNILPQWKLSEIGGLSVLEPEFEAITFEQEVHVPYKMTLDNCELKILVRDRVLSLELSDFEKGVIYKPKSVSAFVTKVEQQSYPGGILILAEDGERINLQTIRNYKKFIGEIKNKKSIKMLKISEYLSKNKMVIDERYFPSSTFQHDLLPWTNSMDDQMFLLYLKRAEELIQNLEISSPRLNNKVEGLVNQAKENLLKAQDSGCLFWKFHSRTRVPCWELSRKALLYAQEAMILLREEKACSR